ncbi:hypothetical protein [Viridibacillus arvi]|uniref:hypothetical protein n=1 Tax=Viridibacillus arvi TaxID=263475 RepID=UPI003CFF82E0
MKRIKIDANVIEQKLKGVKVNDKPVEVNFEEGYILDWNDTNDVLEQLPKDKHGVYTIFEEDKCIYVGKTWATNGFYGRLSAHEKLDTFKKRADKITLFFIEKDNTNEILLFERIKISQLEPILNRDDDIAKMKSDAAIKSAIDYYNLYLSKVLLNEKMLVEIKEKGIDIEDFTKEFLNRFNKIRRNVPIENYLYDYCESEFNLTEYFCSKCADTGKTDASADENDFNCDCEIGKQKFFDEHGMEQDEIK